MSRSLAGSNRPVQPGNATTAGYGPVPAGRYSSPLIGSPGSACATLPRCAASRAANGDGGTPALRNHTVSAVAAPIQIYVASMSQQAPVKADNARRMPVMSRAARIGAGGLEQSCRGDRQLGPRAYLPSGEMDALPCQDHAG